MAMARYLMKRFFRIKAAILNVAVGARCLRLVEYYYYAVIVAVPSAEEGEWRISWSRTRPKAGMSIVTGGGYGREISGGRLRANRCSRQIFLTPLQIPTW